MTAFKDSAGGSVRAIRFDGRNAGAIKQLTGLSVYVDMYQTVQLSVNGYAQILQKETWVLKHEGGRVELMTLRQFASRYERTTE